LNEMNWGEGIQTADEKREIKRQAILRVAARAFNRSGFYKTSLTYLAEQLKVTKPALYYYVKNKDDILFGILELATQQFRQKIEATNHFSGAGLEKLRYFYQQYATVVTDDFGICLILMRINSPESKFCNHYRTLSSEVLNAMVELIQLGLDDGSIRHCDPKYMASAMLGTMNETVYWHVFDERESPIAAADKFFENFLNGLGAATM